MTGHRKPEGPAGPRLRKEWGCPLTKNRTTRCFALCTPDGTTGFCGRVAPHALSGATRDAILAHGPLRIPA